jgi:hypothetical protein
MMKNTYLFLGALILAVTAFVIFSSRDEGPPYNQ